ncbi:hypothetical protein LBMAG42_06260 [Deltaproteobacteria bacterium]|nr:hypothetical protein LBMAG42_06260 [Deltaproteobacteria bacterium]
MLLLILAMARAVAATGAWWLESPEMLERASAATVESAAAKAGYSVRVVKRFHLGEGWEFVALVEGFADEAAATAAARSLNKDTGVVMTLVHDPAKGPPVRTSVDDAKKAAVVPVSDAAGVIAGCIAAHGGATGGAAALARAPAVRFEFEREFDLDSRHLVVGHEYWRDATSRRLEVRAKGGGASSLSVATANGAWIRVGDQVEKRDIGVLISQADTFAPEVVLGVALDVQTLLGGPGSEELLLLEGAESGVRVGRGEDPSEPGLAFADIDPGSGHLDRVRYVTEGGAVLFEMRDWKLLAPGVLVPGTMTLERADGRRETIHVKRLEMADTAPAGTFNAPEKDTPSP